MIGSWSSFDKSRFARTVNIAQKSLGNSSLRHRAITNNIANVDTPHYKRKMIAFEAELNRVIAQERQDFVPFKSTHSHHLPLDTPKTYLDVSPRLHEEYDTNYRNDKNNVDIEKEMNDMVKNVLHYNASATFIANGFKRIKSVMTSV